MEMMRKLLYSKDIMYYDNVLCYATSPINRNLTEKDIAYLKSFTFDIIDDFNTINPSEYVRIKLSHMDRIWYDAMYFFTSEESQRLLTTLGQDTYKHEVLRLR